MNKEMLYINFEKYFRGGESLVKERLKFYLPLIKRLKEYKQNLKILDIGCGRCEFLEILSNQGVESIGIDINCKNIEICKQKGIKAFCKDVKIYLKELPTKSLDIAFLIQVAEHLDISDLDNLFHLLQKVLKDDGILIVEIPYLKNPLVGLYYFWLDPTHKRPLPEDFLIFLARENSFNYYVKFYLNSFYKKNFLRLYFLRDYLESIAGDVSLIFFKQEDTYKKLERVLQEMNLLRCLSYEEALEKFSFYSDFYLNFLNRERWLYEIEQQNLKRQLDFLLQEIKQLTSLIKETNKQISIFQKEILSIKKDVSLLKKWSFKYALYKIREYVQKFFKKKN
jgi:SAM-dependent methyltransferase